MPTLVNKTHHFFEGWLTLHPDEQMKLTSNRPKSISGGARVMAISIQVPTSLFGIPELKAVVKISEEQARSLRVDTNAMASALAHIVGAEITFDVRYPDLPPLAEGADQ